MMIVKNESLDKELDVMKEKTIIGTVKLLSSMKRFKYLLKNLKIFSDEDYPKSNSVLEKIKLPEIIKHQIFKQYQVSHIKIVS